jgi:hypothetical protein
MPASEAQIRANQANAARSTGPKTEEGKARSRANSLKHGLTGEGIVLPEEDAAEVERLSIAFESEFKADGEVGKMLAKRMATMAVRMDRCVDQENASLAKNVRQALDEFEAPEGVDAATAARLRDEAGRIALFDASKPACLARKYEAAAERCFFRSLKELRQLIKDAGKAPAAQAASETAAQLKSSMTHLGSFLPAKPTPPTAPAQPIKPALKHLEPAAMPWEMPLSGITEVPFAIGGLR